MEFTNLEKSAIIRVLTDIMLADGVIDPGEKSYLIQIFGVLNTNKTILDKVKTIKVSESLAILSQMSDINKTALALMMQQMIEADNDIDEKEMEIFFVVFAGAGIPLPDNLKK